MSYTDHSNRKLDLTVTDKGLPLVLKFIARLDIWRDAHGNDPFTRADDPLCLAYRMAPDGRGVYLRLITRDNSDEDWTKLPSGMRAGTLAAKIRRLLKPAEDNPEFEGLTEPGWRIRNPIDAIWADQEADFEPPYSDNDVYEPEDFELAFAYVEPYLCEYAK